MFKCLGARVCMCVSMHMHVSLCVGVWVWLLQMGASFINSTCQWCCLFDVVFVLHFKTLSSLKLVRIWIWILSGIVWLQNLHLPFHSLVRNCRWLHIFQHRTVNVEGIWKQAHILVKLTLNVLTVLLVFTYIVNHNCTVCLSRLSKARTMHNITALVLIVLCLRSSQR